MEGQIPRWQDHLGLLAGATAAALTVFNLLGMAGWQVPIALAVLQSAGSANVLLGSAVALAPVTLGVSLEVLLMFVIWRTLHETTRSLLWVLIAVVALTLGLVAVPIFFFSLAVTCAVIYGLVQRKKEPIATIPEMLARIRGSIVLALLPQILLQFWSGIAWIPSESFSLEGESQPIVGYLLNESPELAILINQPRTIRYFDGPITHREICATGSWTVKTLPQLFQNEGLPACNG